MRIAVCVNKYDINREITKPNFELCNHLKYRKLQLYSMMLMQ